MSTVIINPGTGRVPCAREASARANIRRFCEMLLIGPVLARRTLAKPRDGRYRYDLRANGHRCCVDMPGIPLARVRGPVLTAPRLYVDGASWWWRYALDAARDSLAP